MEFEVEAVRAVRLSDNGREFLVHWKGYDEDSDTWEPEANLQNCPLALENFWKAYRGTEAVGKLDGISTHLCNGEVLYALDYGEQNVIVTKRYLIRYYYQDLIEFSPA